MRKAILSIIPLAALAAPLAFAAPQQPPSQPTPSGQPSTMQMPKSHVQVSDATLHKFASAYEDQMKLRPKYMARLQNAKNDQDKQKVQKDAENAMKKAIKKHMSIEEYKKVGEAVNSDPQLRQKLVKILRADQKKSEPPQPQTA